MKHADPQVRRAAYRAFAKFSLGAEGKTAVPLLRGALRDQDLAIRRFAFEALQQQGEK
jgi:HEAT repeat protein